MDELFETYNRKGNFVAGVVIEPVQAEGGDHHGSPAFFQVSRSQNSPSSEKTKRSGAGLIGSSVFFCWCSGPASADAQTRRGADRRRGADGRRRLGQILVSRALRSAQTGRPRHLQQEDAHWWILQFARVQVAHHPDPFRCQSRVPAVTDRLSLRDGLLSRLGFFYLVLRPRVNSFQTGMKPLARTARFLAVLVDGAISGPGFSTEFIKTGRILFRVWIGSGFDQFFHLLFFPDTHSKSSQSKAEP